MTTKIVLKASGSQEKFFAQKIFTSIFAAAQSVGGTDQLLAKTLKNEVVYILKNRFTNGELVATSEIGELVEKVLIEHGHAKTAKAYIRFRENKRHLRQDVNSLGIKDDIGLSYNTLYILKTRYLKRNSQGEITETPKGLVSRVANALSQVEKTKALRDKYYQEFFDLMINFEFLPGTRTLVNAGKKASQLANCFVWNINDDIDHIFQTLHQSTLIKKHGGGCGYNFSKIRPEGDLVASIPGLAAGPVKMIEMFDLMTSLFKQEGRYESGNMAVLNANHPDIFNFISAKQTDGYLPKTNLSVGITNDFMKAALKGKDWDLINPRTGKVVNTVNARSILNLMAQMAWATGDPGILNLTAINKGTALANPLLKKRGPIHSTNVCGEIPLYPYESCNLGYVNFTKFIKNNHFDFQRLSQVVSIATRLMDNVIDASWFPVRQVDQAVRDHRRLGIGCVGWAEALTLLEIPYDSNEAFQLAEHVAKTMYQSAFKASCKLAKEKGPFPLIKDSIWANQKTQPRNVALITFPPSSGNAVICETSFGIEPYFAFVYEQNVLDGMRLRTVIPAFTHALKERGIYSDELLQKVIDNHGSVQGIKEIPKDIQKVFKVAHDIHWRDHLKMQAAFQRWTDNAITKTINMPASATPKDIEDAYVLSWRLGCKGITIYRDHSKQNQVFEFGRRKSSPMTCPDCQIPLKKDNKCFKCPRCGFSTCEI